MFGVSPSQILRTIPVLVVACFFAIPAHARYSGGSGTAENPYQIATAADLIALGETPEDYDKHFILTADIDLDPNLPGGRVFDRAVIAPDTNDVTEWFEGTGFAGVFDGNGHTISHLTIAGGSYLGLFGQLERSWRLASLGTAVENLAVADVRITGTGDYVGGLVGHNYGSTVTQCYGSGVVSGNSYVGGLVCMETTPSRGGRTIMDCYSTAAVSAATACAGGLVGYNDGTIIRCYSTGPVSAPVGAGGLAGGEEYYGSVTDCFWDIETSGQAMSFGGVGKTTLEMHAASTFVPWGACVSVWTIDDGRDYPRLAWENAPGQIIAGPSYGGGTGTDEDPYLIATAEHLSTLGASTCHNDKHFKLVADIDLSGRTWTGSVVPSFSGVFDGDTHIISGLTITGAGSLGLFGQLASGAAVRDLGVIDVNVIGAEYYVGALTGRNDGGIVTHCFSTGLVSGTGSVGGLMGSNGGGLTWCYSACVVSGDQRVGGLVGSNSGDVARCYSTGSVGGNTFVGGLIGDGSPAGALHCVWDVETSGVSASAGGVGLTTGEMMDPYMLGLNGFAADPNWVLDAGRQYLRLAWQGTAGATVPEPTVDWLEGQGTAEEPYRIDTADQLILLGKGSVLWDKHFVLGADIDLDPNLPEGSVFVQAIVPVFSGVFDGDGHTISSLTIQGGSYLGLFGWVGDPNSEIRNLGLIDPNVDGRDRLGALAGWMESGTLSNCRVVDANIVGTGQVGGLTASHQSGTISECSVLGGHVSGNSTAGGLVGSGDRIVRCSVRQVEVVSTAVFFGSAGGLAGSAKEIVDCHVTGGLVRGLTDIGGLVARMAGGTISGCCTSTRVEAAAEGLSLWLNMGGLVGANAGTIENSYATSTVTQTNAGNLFLLGPSGTGGLVGLNHGTIRLSYSTGAVVTAPDLGTFGSALDVGGLAGYSYGDAIEHSFWDTETSGQTESAGGRGLTTAEMRTASTFLDAGWDFVGETENGPNDVWKIVEGLDYPRLAWEKYSGGSGTAADPYQITTAADLIALGETPEDYDKHFILTADIDLDPNLPGGKVFDKAIIAADTIVLWYSGSGFSGVFDGDGHKILHMTIVGESRLGLFGRLTGQVKNLGIQDVNVAGSHYVGGLVGINSGTIRQCYSTGVVSGGGSAVGGLVGLNGGFFIAAVRNSYSTCSVLGGEAGGLVGRNGMGTLFARQGFGTISNCYSTGSVSGGTAGGLVGSCSHVVGNQVPVGEASCSFWDIQTSGQSTSAGGMGETTVEMQTATTFLDAGWDFVGETANGTDDIWWIDEGRGYPRLWWAARP